MTEQMKGFKKTVAILAIVQGALSILGAVVCMILVVVFRRGRIFHYGENSIGKDFVEDPGIWPDVFRDGLIPILTGLMVFAAIVSLAFGITYIILGKKFFSEKPDKGIAIAIIVFGFLNLSVLSIVSIVYTFIYLSKLNGQTSPQALANNQPASQPNAGSYINQPASAAFCSRCGARSEPGNKFCNMCGGHL